ncbi:Maf family protein [bacterium]|nr:Maf family protein [bacterium]
MMNRIPKLILASRSPRRASLLKQMGFSFDVISVPVPEESVTILDPEERTIALSHKKASAVLDRVYEGIVIGADTIVCLEGEILGKPKSKEEAKAMLLKLSGKTHEVYTGFTLIHIGGRLYSDVERTSVTFRVLEEWEINDYVKTGGPLDKAGGYGIQDRSGLFVDRIDGCFYNVVGFPLMKFWEGLKELLHVKTLRHLLD